MQFSITAVGNTVESDISDVIKRFVDDLAAVGHKVHTVRLLTDAGEKIITPVAEEVGKAVDEIAPAAAPEVETVESDISEAGTVVDAVDDGTKGTPVVTADADTTVVKSDSFLTKVEDEIEKIEDEVKDHFAPPTTPTPTPTAVSTPTDPTVPTPTPVDVSGTALVDDSTPVVASNPTPTPNPTNVTEGTTNG